MRTSAGMEAGSGNENLNKLCAINGVLSPGTRNPSATYLFTNDFGYSTFGSIMLVSSVIGCQQVCNSKQLAMQEHAT